MFEILETWKNGYTKFQVKKPGTQTVDNLWGHISLSNFALLMVDG